MEAIRQWALSLCVAAVAGAASEMLLPEGGAQKIYRISFSVFFLCCLFFPLIGMTGISFGGVSLKETAGDSRAAELQNALEEQFTSDFRAAAEEKTVETLEASGICGTKVEADVNIDDSGSILIERLIVTVPSGEEASEEKIKAIVEKAIGISPEVDFLKE